MSDAVLDELRRINARLDALGGAAREPVAVKRREAARLMGISIRKLELLLVGGKVRTTEDPRLVPMAEVKRYCAPKAKRKRRPAVGYRARLKNVDGQGDEAIEQARRAMRSRI